MAEAYKHQEYPKHLHHHDKRDVAVVGSPEEEAAAKKAGYQLEPFPPQWALEAAADEPEPEAVPKPKRTRKPAAE